MGVGVVIVVVVVSTFVVNARIPKHKHKIAPTTKAIKVKDIFLYFRNHFAQLEDDDEGSSVLELSYMMK